MPSFLTHPAALQLAAIEALVVRKMNVQFLESAELPAVEALEASKSKRW
jgi:hypothetical protein